MRYAAGKTVATASAMDVLAMALRSRSGRRLFVVRLSVVRPIVVKTLAGAREHRHLRSRRVLHQEDRDLSSSAEAGHYDRHSGRGETLEAAGNQE